MVIGCLRLSDVSVICRVVGCRKIKEVTCTECTCQWNDFELIPTIEMETSNPVEGYFDTEFPAICILQSLRSSGGLKSQDVKHFGEIFFTPDFIQIGSLSAE